MKVLGKLSSSILPQLGSTDVAVPQYDRSALEPGILHVGLGNFHRAHMASYLDDLFNENKDDSEINKWGIVGASMFDKKKRDLLKTQDWMQACVMRDATTTTAKILGPMVDYLVSGEAIQEALEGDGIKIVSLTVTEGGYFLNDGNFDPEHPLIQEDIKTPDDPKTVFGIIVKALKKYKESDSGTTPFTVMSCDNIPHNGDVVKSVVVGLAKETDADLAKWIDENVGFPNAMVDRIAPATTDEQRDFVKSTYGLEDSIPVFCEPFRQWVLEDNFSAGRPKFETLDGVTFVKDVGPYEFAKIRILNGGHASLCYPSALLGLDCVDNAMEHPTISPFLDALEANEIIPTVPPVPDTDLPDYWKIIAERFANPTLKDTIDRNCYDGASRQPKFIVPVVADNLDAGRKVDGLALVSAMWCTYCQGKTEAGEDIPDNDPRWDELQALAKKAVAEPVQWLEGLPDVYGKTAKSSVFQDAFSKALKAVEADGVEAAMKQYTASVN